MCRYALNSYKPHYVCFDCRKVFKQPILSDIIKRNGDWISYKRAFLNRNLTDANQFKLENPDLIRRFENQYQNKQYKCPDCATEMFSIGLDFRAPKKSKIKEWKIIRSMYEVGNTFHTCGCDGPGYIPKNGRDHLGDLQKIREKYLNHLEVRCEEVSQEQLSDYLNYWAGKLTLVNHEINKIKHQ